MDFFEEEVDRGELLTSFKGIFGVEGCLMSLSVIFFSSDSEGFLEEVSLAEVFGVSFEEEDFFKVVFVWDFWSFGLFVAVS